MFEDWPSNLLLFESISEPTWSRHDEAHVNFLDFITHLYHFEQLVKVLIGIHIKEIAAHEDHHVFIVCSCCYHILSKVNQLSTLLLSILLHKSRICL